MLLVHEPAVVHVSHVSDGLVSVVRVQACWAFAAATRALMAASWLYML